MNFFIKGNIKLNDGQKDACFICSTPYQIMIAIAFVFEAKIRADLYVNVDFKLDGLLERIAEVRVFDNIIINDHVYRESQSRGNLLRKFKTLLKINEKRCFLTNLNKHYDYVYGVCCGFEMLLILRFCSKGSLATEICYFEDGVGRYCSDNTFHFFEILSMQWKLLLKIMKLKKPLEYREKLCLYSPALYRTLNPESKRTIGQIPHIWHNHTIVERCKYLFGVDKFNPVKIYSIILLDILIDEFFLVEEPKIMLKNIYRKIFETFGEKRIIIKKHPRDNMDNIVNVHKRNYMKNFSVPFEVLCLGVDLEQKLFISYASTSFGSLKFMLDVEPYVLMLYKVFGNFNKMNEKYDRYYHAVKSMYRNPEKFMIPETMEELDECLKKLKEIYVK